MPEQDDPTTPSASGPRRGRALPDAAGRRSEALGAPTARERAAPTAFVRGTPERAVAEAVRRRRALAGALGLGGAALAGAVAALLSSLTPGAAAVDPTDVGDRGLPEELVAALRALEDDLGDHRVRRRPPPPPPRPGDVRIELPVDHPYRSWALRCPTTSMPPPRTDGSIPGGEHVVRIPDVPPVRCNVSLAGPGAPTIDVRAGSVVRCHLAGNLVCEGGA